MCAQVEDTDTCYPITSNQSRDEGFRGIGLAIVNSFYNFPGMVRKGAEHDKETLSQLFTSLKLEFRAGFELTKDKIVTLLKTTAKDPKLKSDSMIAIAFSSHGCEEGLLGINIQDRLIHGHDPEYRNAKDCISPTEIHEIFNGENCRALAGKPKLFLLNGCRGHGVEVIVPKELVAEKLTADGIEPAPVSEEDIATTWSDFFTIHSCVPGKISMLSNIEGSLFFIEFSKAYAKYGHTRPIESIMPTVNRNLIKVCKTKRALSAQCCTWESTCTQSFLIPQTDDKIEPVPKETTRQQADVRPLPHPRDRKNTQNTGNNVNPMPSHPGFSNKSMTSLSGLVTAKSGDVYVTDPASECIWVFSGGVQAKFQDIPSRNISFPDHGLANCSGICIQNDSLFVSCNDQIKKLSSSSGKLVNSYSADTAITGLAIDDDDSLYACEKHTCKILVLDMDLIPIYKLDLRTLHTHKDRLLDIKVFNGLIYVLISGTQAAIQTFDKEGHHIADIVSSELLKECYFFTMHRENGNIYAGDVAANELKAFSINKCNLIWKQSVYGDDLAKIKGIDLNADNEVVIALMCNAKCMLQSFHI